MYAELVEPVVSIASIEATDRNWIVGVGVGVWFCVLVNVIVGVTVGVVVTCGVGVTEAKGGIILSLLLFAKEPDRISASKEAILFSSLTLALCKSLLLGGNAIY